MTSDPTTPPLEHETEGAASETHCLAASTLPPEPSGTSASISPPHREAGAESRTKPSTSKRTARRASVVAPTSEAKRVRLVDLVPSDLLGQLARGALARIQARTHAALAGALSLDGTPAQAGAVSVSDEGGTVEIVPGNKRRSN